ncbi:heat shock protein HspQ [Bradyrhizobium sp.]|uniref:heat shock protein HspQ n=1 Tax=Bradyrhizobium sp. TaxID=376 RepID=UPI003C718D2D
MSKMSIAKFGIGHVIRHRIYEFRGVVFDVDPEFADCNGTHEAIMVEARSRKDQPFYYLFAENDQNPYIAYVSEQNLMPDASGEPVCHPQLDNLFERDEKGCYRRRNVMMN